MGGEARDPAMHARRGARWGRGSHAAAMSAKRRVFIITGRKRVVWRYRAPLRVARSRRPSGPGAVPPSPLGRDSRLPDVTERDEPVTGRAGAGHGTGRSRSRDGPEPVTGRAGALQRNGDLGHRVDGGVTTKFDKERQGRIFHHARMATWGTGWTEGCAGPRRLRVRDERSDSDLMKDLTRI